jgi:hypothetical protein
VRYVRSIRVTDANGDELTVHEFERRQLLRRISRWQLDTGEPVTARCAESFVVAGTGELLKRA